MSDEMEVSILSDKSAKLLSRLNDCFEKHNIFEPQNLGVRTVEKKVYKNQITWPISRSDLEITENKKSFKSSQIKVEFLNIGNVWLEMYPKRGEDGPPLINADLFLCFGNVPENMYIQCDVFVLNNNKNIIWEERHCAKASEIHEKKVGFNTFIGLDSQTNQLQKKIFIQCNLKLHSAIYESNNKKYIVSVTPEIDHRMEDILKSEKYSDVVINLEESRKKSHKCILASKSPALRVLLKLKRENELELKDKDSTVLTDIINFMYTEDIKILDFQHAWNMYIAASKYDVLNLKDLCSAYLNANLTEKSISRIFDLARKEKDLPLVKACLAFMKHDIDASAFISN